MPAVQYAREKKVPFLGICLGMQMAVMEFARHVLGYARRQHRRDGSRHHLIRVIDLMPDQRNLDNRAAPCAWASITALLMPRHVQPQGVRQPARSTSGTATATSSTTTTWSALRRAACVVGGPATPSATWWRLWRFPTTPGLWPFSSIPELKSRPNRPHPLFRDFVGAALKHGEERKAMSSAREGTFLKKSPLPRAPS